jgi:alpha-tubulin suppressor-like RCC1 family protein
MEANMNSRSLGDAPGTLRRVPMLLVLAAVTALLAVLLSASVARAQAPGYNQVSAGLYHSCAIHQFFEGMPGPVDCWGSNYHGDKRTGQASPPSGVEFSQVTAGGFHTCGLKPDGYVQCWGSNEKLLECTETGCAYVYGGQASPPATRFKQISAGLYHTCGVTVDGNVDCWGYNPHGETADRTGGNWVEVSAGENHTCALRADGVVDCWGQNANGRAEPRLGPFTHVSAGGSHNCAIRQADGKVECWGGNLYGQSAPPDLAFTLISAGNLHTCGTRADSSWPNWIECWGYNFYGQVKQAPDGQFRKIDSGQGHTCGVTFTSEVHCWGRNDYGQANVPGLGGPIGAPVYDFQGFFPPVSPDPALNAVKAGSVVPLKFSLGGDEGLQVIEAGYPASGLLSCTTMEPSEDLQATQAAGKSGLSYDATSGQYTYAWKTEKDWSGTCRYLSLRLVDGTEHRAAFQFK